MQYLFWNLCRCRKQERLGFTTGFSISFSSCMSCRHFVVCHPPSLGGGLVVYQLVCSVRKMWDNRCCKTTVLMSVEMYLGILKRKSRYNHHLSFKHCLTPLLGSAYFLMMLLLSLTMCICICMH